MTLGIFLNEHRMDMNGYITMEVLCTQIESHTHLFESNLIINTPKI